MNSKYIEQPIVFLQTMTFKELMLWEHKMSKTVINTNTKHMIQKPTQHKCEKMVRYHDTMIIGALVH